jgi:hypothetical protein
VGAALTAFCTNNRWPQYFCHRHLIEVFGASSPLGILVAQALRETSARSYLEHREQYLADAAALHDLALVDNHDYEKFCSFLSEDFQHGIWHRISDGISSCSNHAERFHRVVNHHLPARASLPLRLCVIRDQMNAKYEKFGSQGKEQFQDIVRHLRECHAPATSPCPNVYCADFVEIMKHRFGLGSFPCKHTAHESRWNVIRPAPLEKLMLAQNPHAHQTEEIRRRKPFPRAFLHRHSTKKDIETADASRHSIPTWDDSTILAPGEGAPVALEDATEHPLEEWERRDKSIARDITDGIFRIREARRACTLDKRDVIVDVWEDLRNNTVANASTSRLEIAAICKAHWWKWAKHDDEERPIPAHGWSGPPVVE